MIKLIHLTFILLSIFSFVGRVILSETNSNLMKTPLFNIGPHVINGILLASGIILVFQGSWLSGESAWLAAKIAALTGYIGLGIMTLKTRGQTRWLAFAGAMACFIYIGIVAVTKNPVFFL